MKEAKQLRQLGVYTDSGPRLLMRR